MKPRSAKNKGVRLQNWIRDQILETYHTLESEDVRPAIMGENGVDIKLTQKAKALFPFEIEAKNVQSINVWKSFDQAESNSGERQALLVIKKNRRAPLAVVDAEWLFENIIKLNRSK